MPACRARRRPAASASPPRDPMSQARCAGLRPRSGTLRAWLTRRRPTEQDRRTTRPPSSSCRRSSRSSAGVRAREPASRSRQPEPPTNRPVTEPVQPTATEPAVSRSPTHAVDDTEEPARSSRCRSRPPPSRYVEDPAPRRARAHERAGPAQGGRPRRGLPTLPAPLAALLGGLVVGRRRLPGSPASPCAAARRSAAPRRAAAPGVRGDLRDPGADGAARRRGARAAAPAAKPGRRASSAVGVLFVVVLLSPQDALFSVVDVPGGPARQRARRSSLAHWVTTTFVEPPPERGPEHDVR